MSQTCCLNCYKGINRETDFHTNVGDKVFCSNECTMEHLDIEKRLENAADPFNENRIYTSKKMRFPNTPYREADEFGEYA